MVRPGPQGAAEIAAAMDLLRHRLPERLGGRRGHRLPPTSARGPRRRPRWLAATPLVALDLGEAGRALVRPSGTEPKLKIYVEVLAEVASVGAVPGAAAAARDTAVAAADELVAFLGLGG